jgi:hypothetical protein
MDAGHTLGSSRHRLLQGRLFRWSQLLVLKHAKPDQRHPQRVAFFFARTNHGLPVLAAVPLAMRPMVNEIVLLTGHLHKNGHLISQFCSPVRTIPSTSSLKIFTSFIKKLTSNACNPHGY